VCPGRRFVQRERKKPSLARRERGKKSGLCPRRRTATTYIGVGALAAAERPAMTHILEIKEPREGKKGGLYGGLRGQNCPTSRASLLDSEMRVFALGKMSLGGFYQPAQLKRRSLRGLDIPLKRKKKKSDEEHG